MDKTVEVSQAARDAALTDDHVRRLKLIADMPEIDPEVRRAGILWFTPQQARALLEVTSRATPSTDAVRSDTVLCEAAKTKRRALGWSLRDLEAETGIGFSTLARFERGERIGARVRAHLTEWVSVSPATRATQPEAALREAVEPIAGRANGYDGLPPPKYFGDTDCELRFPNSLKIEVTLGELRALRAALKDHRHG